MHRSTCSFLFYFVLVTCVSSTLGTSYNDCIPYVATKPNPYQMSFIGIKGKMLSQKDDVNNVIWKLGICGQIDCEYGNTDGMLTQEVLDKVPGQCYSYGEVAKSSPWSVSRDNNYVLTTNPAADSTPDCTQGMRQTQVEFVCDEDADTDSMSFTVTPPREGTTACGTYYVKLKTCLACASSRFGKCATKPSPSPKPSPGPAPGPSPKPSPGPAPEPSPKPSPKPTPGPAGSPWYIFVLVGFAAFAAGAATIFVFRNRFDTRNAQASALNTGLLKKDGIAEEYTPPALVEDARV